MTAATVASVASSHVYNGDGLRMSQTANSVTTEYAWDATAALPVVIDDETLRYVYGLDLIAAIDATDDETYFSYDGLGSTTDLTDDTGAVVATYQYDVFGAVRASTGSSDNVFQFTGEQLDPESGLYFLRARYLDPESGRFISRDIVEFPQRYSYAFSNPTLYVDPNGEFGIPRITCDLCGRAARAAEAGISTVVRGADHCLQHDVCSMAASVGAGVAAGVVSGNPGIGFAVGGAVASFADGRQCFAGDRVACGLAVADGVGAGAVGLASRGLVLGTTTVRAALRGTRFHSPAGGAIEAVRSLVVGRAFRAASSADYGGRLLQYGFATDVAQIVSGMTDQRTMSARE